MKKKKWLLSCALIFVLLIAAMLAYFSPTTLSIRDVIRLSRKGEDLRMQDFTRYPGTIYGNSFSESIEFTLSDEYMLEVCALTGDERPTEILLWYTPIHACFIDIRYSDVAEFIRAEDKSKYIFSYNSMTLDDVRLLSELGNDLRHGHLLHYTHGGYRTSSNGTPDEISRNPEVVGAYLGTAVESEGGAKDA